MIQTLIVEDEVLARLGLHQLVNWEALGFELIEDAKTGSEALQKIQKHHPQVIILDLNIPEFNGVEIQKYIVDHKLACETVVISCNDDFTTVKEIMRLGAFDFLRKLNLSAESLTNVLLRLKQHLNTEAPAETKEEDVPKKISYASLLMEANIDFYKPPFCCVIYIVGCVSPLEVLMKQPLPRHSCILTRGEHGLYLLLREAQPDAFFESIHACMNEECFFGVYEGKIGGLSDLNQALSCVESINVFAYYDCNQPIMRFDKPLTLCLAPSFDFDAICGRIKFALSTLCETDMRNAFVELFAQLRRNDMLALNLLRRMFMDILGMFSASAQRMHGNIEDVFVDGENYHYQTILQMNSLQAVESWFLRFAHEFVATFYIPYKCMSSDILRSVFAYIDANISQPIQLSAAAKHVGISENYLSSYFKKEIGKNFVTYVNIRKIEKAKELLRANCLVYQVSESLGFENTTYFTKVFKRYVGVSPDAYRKQFNAIGD